MKPIPRVLLALMVSAAPLHAATVGAGNPPKMDGLKMLPQGDEGSFELETVAGTPGWGLRPGKSPVRFGYFSILEAGLKNGASPIAMFTVKYLDRGTGELQIQYDSLEEAKIPGAFKPVKLTTLKNTGEWATASVTVTNARFAGRCNGSDFRIYFSKEAQALIGGITLTGGRQGANPNGGAPTVDPRTGERQKLMDQLPKGSTSHFDLPYVAGAKPGTSPDSIQDLDLFIPPGEGPFPIVIHIHGGGWHSGSKRTGLPIPVLKEGMALASLNYRLTVDAPFPAPYEDCATAIAFLRTQASRYKIDPRRVGLIGHSAGAHLCALLTLAAGRTAFKSSAPAILPFQAAVFQSGPFDIDRERGAWPKTMFAWKEEDRFCKTFFPTGKYDLEFARTSSAASYIHGGLPPMLIAHGDKDPVVPFGQAEKFADDLKTAGNKVTFKAVPGAGHGLPAEATTDAIAFLKEHLTR